MVATREVTLGDAAFFAQTCLAEPPQTWIRLEFSLAQHAKAAVTLLDFEILKRRVSQRGRGVAGRVERVAPHAQLFTAGADREQVCFLWPNGTAQHAHVHAQDRRVRDVFAARTDCFRSYFGDDAVQDVPSAGQRNPGAVVANLILVKAGFSQD